MSYGMFLIELYTARRYSQPSLNKLLHACGCDCARARACGCARGRVCDCARARGRASARVCDDLTFELGDTLLATMNNLRTGNICSPVITFNEARLDNWGPATFLRC